MPRLTRLITYQDRYDLAERIAAGSTEEDVATVLNMPVDRMKRIFRRELAFQAAESKHKVLSKLYEAATSGENINATLFWAKARYGWRDTGTPPPPPAAPINFIVQIAGKEDPASSQFR
jgi:hypothetical protein